VRVLLINPSWDRYISRQGRRINRAWPPLDLLNCAAFLEQEGIQADLLDARSDWVDPSEIARRAEAYDKVFVTSSPLDRWQCPNLELPLFFDRMRPLRHPELYIMGVHGTHFPQAMLENTGAKAVIRGEPELTVLDIARGKPLAEIPGLARLEGGRLVESPSRPLADLTKFPVPAFERVDLGRYGYELMGDRFVILETTRGCPFPCNFCMRDLFGGTAYRCKTPQQVAKEVEVAINQAGARTGYFIDLEFSLNREYTLKVCSALAPFRSKWSWCCQTRADSVDPELLRAMKEAGCALIHFGVESGSEDILAATGKRMTLDQIEKAVDWTRKAGIASACFFMLGLPGETDDDREKTMAFARKINPTYASFHIASPYPGTPLYQTGTWDPMYPESVHQGEELEKIKRWEKKAYRRFYLRPGYMISFLSQISLKKFFKQVRLLWEMI
jgi:radical SAM superfamily enzyme YgiQ (UPF0313 family)